MGDSSWRNYPLTEDYSAPDELYLSWVISMDWCFLSRMKVRKEEDNLDEELFSRDEGIEHLVTTPVSLPLYMSVLKNWGLSIWEIKHVVELCWARLCRTLNVNERMQECQGNNCQQNLSTTLEKEILGLGGGDFPGDLKTVNAS